MTAHLQLPIIITIFFSLLSLASATSPGAILCNAATRISVLTPHVVRLEFSPSGVFEDRPSFAFPRTDLPQEAPALRVSNDTRWCNITVLESGLDVSLAKADGAIPLSKRRSDACVSAPFPGDPVCNRGKCERSREYPGGVAAQTQGDCCALCSSVDDCATWVFDTAASPANATTCWLLQPGTVQGCTSSKDRVMGNISSVPNPLLKNITISGPYSTLPQQRQQQGWIWHAGDAPTNNLLGTLAPTPSADLASCCNNTGGWDPHYPLEPGLLSRDGWATLEDFSDLIDTSGWIIPEGRTPGNTDTYFFGCGHNYTQCLAEYAQVAGKIALPPLPALGIWWSRHWGDPYDHNPFGPMTEDAIMTEVVEGYRQHDVPLNVVVLDMEWHSMLSTTDCETFIGAKGWGGYSWNRTLFPDPQSFVDLLHNNTPGSLRLSLNFHPDEGIDACQDMYKAMASAIGFDTSARATIPDLNQMAQNQTYVDAYFNLVINHTLVDYSWTDSPQVSAWTNSLYDAYMVSLNKRPLVLSRYGGLGNHRSPIGFSGDTKRCWDTLAYEVWMTPKASNIAFGWWSHDIGGFSGSYVDSEYHTESPDLFLRWLQWATYAPIFRTHCRFCEQRIWTFGTYYFPLMREAMVMRNTLGPYIYTNGRRAFDTGRSLLYPLYYDFPEFDEAYDFDTQHMFGADILVAPIISQNVSISRAVWIPPGTWVERTTGLLVSGPSLLNKTYALEQTPVFIRAGAVLPTKTLPDVNATMPDPLVWWVLPGASQGTGSLYEDDGETMGYSSGEQALTLLAYGYLDPNTLQVNISAAQGSFQGMRESRSHQLTLFGKAALPLSATCNGATLAPSPPGTSPGMWVQEEDTAVSGRIGTSVVLACQQSSVKSDLIVEASW